MSDVEILVRVAIVIVVLCFSINMSWITFNFENWRKSYLYFSETHEDENEEVFSTKNM